MFKRISVFNGKIFLYERKKNNLNCFLTAYNKIYKENIIYLDNNSKPDLSNFWLCGFTDAEGCFTCSITNKHLSKGLVRWRYILSPKGNYDQMKYLADMLNGKRHYLKSYDGYNVNFNTTKLSLVIKYFNLHPSKPKKSIVYYNWNKMYMLVVDKTPLTL